MPVPNVPIVVIFVNEILSCAYLMELMYALLYLGPGVDSSSLSVFNVNLFPNPNYTL